VATREIVAVLADLEEHIKSIQSEDWELFDSLKRRLLAAASNGGVETAVTRVGVETARCLASATLIASVRRAFDTYPDASWSPSLLERHLQKKGFSFNAKNPRSSINTALARLVERGIIAVYRQGVGRKQSFYKRFPSGNAAALRGRMMAISDQEPLPSGRC
jgi:hypothetical protein